MSPRPRKVDAAPAPAASAAPRDPLLEALETFGRELMGAGAVREAGLVALAVHEVADLRGSLEFQRAAYSRTAEELEKLRAKAERKPRAPRAPAAPPAGEQHDASSAPDGES